MKHQLFIVAITLLLGTLSLLQAEELQLTGYAIMTLVDERDDGDDRQSELEMTLINHRGATRVREMRSYSKEYGDDSKQVIIFLSPADVAGTGYLSWEYEDEQCDDDRWLYLPALRMVRRISGASNDDYFMGSDFTYDDMGDRNIDEDTHTLLREETLEGQTCWVVESVPLDSDEQYKNRLIWIRQDSYMVIRSEYYDSIGLMKVLSIGDIRQVDGIWTAHSMFMDNLREEHQTRLLLSNVSYNQNLNDNMFTVSAIERGRVQ